MTSTLGYWFIGLDLRSAVTLVFVATTLVFALVVGSALVITSKRLANVCLYLPDLLDFTRVVQTRLRWIKSY